MSNFLEQILNAKVQQLENDAARWTYVRNTLAQAIDPHMDGTSAFRFRSPQGRAGNITELIDRLRGENGMA